MSATTLLNIETAIGSIGRSSANAAVNIGTVTLTGMEVPSRLTVGGGQALVIHRLIGGDRIIDAIGNDPDRIELSGTFIGPTAQERAQLIQSLRQAGKPVPFSAAGLSWQVMIRYFRYDYTAKGAVIPYSLQIELPAEKGNATGSDLTALSKLIGGDATAALSGIATAVSDVSTAAANVTGQLQTIVGQVTPIANIIGLGGPLASAENDLTEVQGIAATGTNLSAVPSALSSTLTGLKTTGQNLTGVISQTSANLSAISLTNPASLLAISQNSELQSASVDAGALVNRSYANALTAGGQSQTGPLVHA